MAAKKGNFDVFKLIFVQVDDKNHMCKKKPFSPLHFAAINGHLEICKLIIENVQDKNPITFEGIESQILANPKEKPYVCSSTPLQLAEAEGHHKVVEYIKSKI